MTIALMKCVDHWVGAPLCLLSELFLHLRGWLTRPRAVEGTPRRMLLIKFWGMGSLVLALPAVRALRETCPGVEIHVLTLAENAAIAPFTDDVDEWLTLNVAEGPLHFAADVGRLVLQLWRTEYDVTMDLEFFVRCTTLLALISGAPRRLGFGSPKLWRNSLHTDVIPYNHFRHITDLYGDFVHRIAPQAVIDRLPRLTPPPPAARAALLHRCGLDGGRPLVAVNVNASSLAWQRRWPPLRFRAVLAQLLQDYPVTVWLLGSPNETTYTGSVAAMLPPSLTAGRLVNLSGMTDLTALLALLQESALLLTNDSGPQHLAAALGVRTVTLFGPETPALYGPRGPEHRVFYTRWPCSPCLSAYNSKTSRCEHQQCMWSIDAGTVMAAMRAALRDEGVMPVGSG